MESNPIYIDTFDDGITLRNVLLDNVPEGSFDGKILNIARFQILLSVLFDRQVIVPEAWLASSPLFLRIFLEVTSAYPETVMRTDNVGGVSQNAPNPFVFCFYKNDGKKPIESYLSTLSERLIRSRVQWLPRTTSADSDADNTARAALAKCLSRYAASYSDHSDETLLRLRDEVVETTADAFDVDYNGQASVVADAVYKVCKYLIKSSVVRETRYWRSDSNQVHEATIARTVRLLRDTIRGTSDLEEQFSENIMEIKEFFLEAEKSEIALNDLMKMWELLPKYGRDTQIAMEAFGRLALNSGISNTVGSNQHTVSFNYYARGNRTLFLDRLLQSTLETSRETNPQRVNHSEFLDVAPSSEYDLANTIDWDSAWTSAAHVAASQEWRVKRKRIEETIVKSELYSDSTIGAWNEIFDAINSAFQDISFYIGQVEDKMVVRVLQRATQKQMLGAGAATVVVALPLIGLGWLLETAAKVYKQIPTSVGLRYSRMVGPIQENNILVTRPMIRSND